MKKLVKHLVMVAIMFAMTSISAFAQSTVKHTVDRGESLATIAKRYGTTEARIIELNPDAAQFIYVGMELTVEVSAASDGKQDAAAPQSNPSGNAIISSQSVSQNGDYQEESSVETEIFAGVSMNNFTGKDIDSDIKIGFHAGILARYYIDQNVFVEGSLGIATKGYKYDTFLTTGSTWNDDGNFDQTTTTKYTTYNIDLPILLGYRFIINEGLNLKIKIGPYLTYALSGKKTEKGYRKEYDSIHSSTGETINNETKIKDIYGFNNFSYGLQVGASVDCNKFIISAYYQHGLSKLVKDTKLYEQNILVSIGYRF